MAKLSRGIIFLLVLFGMYLVTDVSIRRSPVSREKQIADLEQKVAISEAEVKADQVTAATARTNPSSSRANGQSTPTPVPLAMPASKSVLTAHSQSPQLQTGNTDGAQKAKAAGQDSLFDALMVPFVQEALQRRAELAKSDPGYGKRVDAQLNEGRINFLLFGYGETHEPPETEKAIIGSHTIISYDTRTHQASLISLTHDIRAPEIERALQQQGRKTPPVRIDQAYSVGGFDLMRQTLEDATGLSIDFQVAFKDTVLQGLVDGVFGRVQVDVPEAFDVYGFYLDGKKYESGHFARGWQSLSGKQVIQFIKTVPVSEGPYDKSLEHNVRKALIFKALLASLEQQYPDRMFWLKGSAFVTGEMISGNIAYDFDPLSLIVSNIGTTTASIRRSLSQGPSAAAGLPEIVQSKYIVDSAQGDGGVQWVGANAAANPITQRDVANGVYPSMDMEVPLTANPYGDLPAEYWTSVRELVRNALLDQRGF